MLVFQAFLTLTVLIVVIQILYGISRNEHPKYETVYGEDENGYVTIVHQHKIYKQSRPWVFISSAVISMVILVIIAFVRTYIR